MHNPVRPVIVEDTNALLAARAFAAKPPEKPLIPTGVVPGSYSAADVVIGLDGRVTSAANGTSGAGGILRGQALDMFNLPTFL